jgi:hypothetical protein
MLTSASDSNGILRGMYQLASVLVLPDVAVIFDRNSVLTANGGL